MRVVSLEQAIIHARGHEPRHLTQPWHLAAHVLPPRYLSISISTAHLLPPPHLTPFCVVYRVIALRACIRSASLRMYSTRSGASHPPEADIARVRRFCQRRGHGLESGFARERAAARPLAPLPRPGTLASLGRPPHRDRSRRHRTRMEPAEDRTASLRVRARLGGAYPGWRAPPKR